MSDDGKQSRPACANCSRRKTKCDRESPCASCLTAKLECRYSLRRPEKKHRVLHSTRYEESLTYISRQLEDLSSTVHSLVDRIESPSERRSDHGDFNSIARTIHTVTPPYRLEKDANVAKGAGDESRSLHSPEEASSPAQTSDISSRQDAQATAAGIVQTLMSETKQANSPAYEEGLSQSTSANLSEYPELANAIQLPPMDLVLRLLAFARTSPQRYFIDFPQTNEDDFAELCQRIYFPTHSFTIFAWLSVNCGLFFLFRDLDRSQYHKLQLTDSQIPDLVTLCSRNIDAAIKSLKLCVNPSYQAIDAIVCAAMVCMEGAKGFLGWKLASTAARMCIDLGYNRLPPGYGDRTRSQRRKLFWYVYAMDKTLAFNFGRSPTIHDYDVSTERPYANEDYKSKWGMNFVGYIDFTKAQYEMYEQLFSAKAQMEPLSVRVQRVHSFAADIMQSKARFEQSWDRNDTNFRGTAREAVHGVQIGFCSILTLIYRILPPDPSIDGTAVVLEAPGKPHNPLHFHPLCVQSGREALQALIRAWNAVRQDPNRDAGKIFINWTSLFIPFMPFLAVLGNQILAGDQDDLAMLRDVVKIVEAVAQVGGGSVKKMHRAFLRLFRIAEMLMKSKKSNGTTGFSHGNEVSNLSDSSSANKYAAAAAGLSNSPTAPSAHSEQVAPSDAAMHDLHTNTATASNNPDTTTSTSTTTVNKWQSHPHPSYADVNTNANMNMDMEMTTQDWDTFFNEFDLGPGAENAREMMPWFEQHMGDFNGYTF